MDGTAPVPLSLADALGSMEDSRTPKKISISTVPDASPGSISTAASEAVQSTPQKIDISAEALEFSPCGSPPGLDLDLPNGLPSPDNDAEAEQAASELSGGIMGTTPLVDPAAFYEACSLEAASMYCPPSAGPSPCSPYSLFGAEYFADPMQPAMEEAEHFMSLFQGILSDQSDVSPMPTTSADSFPLLASLAEETSDPVLAALAATSPLRPAAPQEQTRVAPPGLPGPCDAGDRAVPPGLPFPTRQPSSLSESKAPAAGSDSCVSDDSTASPATSDAPASASASDAATASPGSESFAMSPEAAPFVPSVLGALSAPLDPLAILATTPPTSSVPAAAVQEPEEGQEKAKHGAGSCRPCAWFWKEVGCSSGKDCEYCHVCPKGALKARKKVKRAMIRLGQAPSPGVQEALSPAPGSPNFVLSLSALL